MKRIFSVLLVLCVIAALLPAMTVFASEVVDSGDCGENLTWSLDSDGTLTVSGTGDMTSAPWSNYRNNVNKIVFKEGVTSICDDAFANFRRVTSIEFADSISVIGVNSLCGISVKEL